MQLLKKYLSIICIFLTVLPVRGQSDNLRKIASLRAKAESLAEKADYMGALTFLEKAKDKSTANKYPLWTANLLLDISSMVFLSGDYRKCADLAIEGINTLEKNNIQDDTTSFKLWSGLGQYYFRLSIVDSSFYYFGKADRLLESKPDLEDLIPVYTIFHYSNQSLAHRSFGRLSQGIRLAEKALTLAKKMADVHNIALLQNVLADQYDKKGDYHLSYELRKGALQTYKHDDPVKVQIYSGLGKTALLKHDAEDAHHFFEKAITLQKKLFKTKVSERNAVYLSNAYNGLAKSLIHLGRYKSAEIYLNHSTEVLRSTPTRSIQFAINRKLWGDLYMASSRVSEAIAAYKRTLEVISSGEPSFQINPGFEKIGIEVLASLGKAHISKKEYPEALNFLHQALNTAHTARQHLLELEEKLFLSESLFPIYKAAIKAAYNVYSTNRDKSTFDKVFQIAVLNHAVTLRDQLLDNELRPGYLPEKLTIREDSLRRVFRQLRNKIERATGNIEQHHDELLVAQQSYFHFLKEIERLYPAYYQAKFLPQNETVEDIRHRLDDQTALLTFSHSDGNLHLFAVTKESYTWKTMPIDSALLSEKIQTLKRSLHTHPGVRQYKGMQESIQVFNWFVRPLYDVVGTKKKWIVQTSGLLDGLPLEILETGKKNNDYLTYYHQVGYIYTISSLLHNPSRPTKPPRILGVAPFSAATVHPIADSTLSAFPSLPESLTEVVNISAPHLLSEDATKQKVLNKLKDFDILHLATHGRTNYDDVMNSFVAFYPQTGHSTNWHGYEISEENLQHIRMTVLSACDTEKGRNYPMEGMISLARCFAHAGCPTLVSTLWNAHDKSTALLIDHFYLYLKQGTSPSEALHQARIKFLNSEAGKRFNHPFFWGNFVLIGVDTPIFPESSINKTALHLVLLCSILVFIGLAFRNRILTKKKQPLLSGRSSTCR